MGSEAVNLDQPERAIAVGANVIVTVTELCWRCPPSACSLSMDDVHVWRAWLDQPLECAQQLAEALSADEQDLYAELVEGGLGDRARLEQERVDWGWVERKLSEVGC